MGGSVSYPKVSGKILGFGGNAIPIKNASELESALDVYSDRFVQVYETTVSVTATGGSASVSFTGETFRTNEKIWVGDVFRIDGGARNYKIKNITNDTTLVAHEPILAADEVSGTVTVTFYRLERKTLILMPGEYTGLFRLSPGIDLVGTCLRSTKISEQQGAPYAPFYNFSDNVISNVTLGPTDAFSSCDGGVQSNDFINITEAGANPSWDNTTHWAGQTGIIQDCELNILNAGGDHSGGTATFPVLPAGRVIVKNTLVNNDSYTSFAAPNTSTASGRGAIDNSYYDETNTIVNLINTDVTLQSGWDTDQAATQLSYGGYLLDVGATYNIGGGSVRTIEDLAVNPVLFSVAGVSIQSTSAIIANIGGGFEVNIDNTSGDATNPTVGVDAGSASTVNMTHTNIESAGTGALGARTNNASAVANIRHSRVKGGTNSLVNTTGTINAAGSVTTIGATSGTITATET